MSNTASLSYKWGQKGRQPFIEQKQYKRERITLFGCVNPISGEVIVQKSQRGNAKTFKKYLKKLLYFYANSKGKIHLILDNVRYHHAKILIALFRKT